MQSLEVCLPCPRQTLCEDRRKKIQFICNRQKTQDGNLWLRGPLTGMGLETDAGTHTREHKKVGQECVCEYTYVCVYVSFLAHSAVWSPLSPGCPLPVFNILSRAELNQELDLSSHFHYTDDMHSDVTEVLYLILTVDV